MTDTSKASQSDILEQLQAGHRARIDGAMLENWNKEAVVFQQVTPEDTGTSEPAQPVENMESTQPESYRSYASRLLEEMRGVYASSWDECSCGSNPAWKGGHNHFYDPCSGADNPPASECPVYDCDNSCCGNAHHSPKPPRPPKPPKPPYYPEQDCGCGTTTYYDDCAYKLQKMSDQLTRMEAMLQELYSFNQQLAGYCINAYSK